MSFSCPVAQPIGWPGIYDQQRAQGQPFAHLRQTRPRTTCCYAPFSVRFHRDPAARVITNPVLGPRGPTLHRRFSSGTIYVFHSKSTHPLVAAHRDVLHKVGVTVGKVDARLANAILDPTFLLAEVGVIATYELSNINAE